MVQAKANPNFRSLFGSSVPDPKPTGYDEYRRIWMEYPKDFIVRDFPVHLDIEATSRCNLRCTFCDKLPLLSKEQMGDIDIALFRRIIDEGAEKGLMSLKLSYRGEPLLHKRIAELVSYGKHKGLLDIYFNSNGMLLSKDMSARLMDAGLDRISISVEGIDPIAFERERRGAKFDRILKNIEDLMALKQQRGVSFPKVRVQTVYLPQIDLNTYREFWRTRCDEVAAIDFKDVVNREDNLRSEDWACPQLWQRMTIEFNGRIMPCNNDDYGKLSPGNAENKSIYESWHDPIVEKARQLHKQGQSHQVTACQGCPWRTAQIRKDG